MKPFSDFMTEKTGKKHGWIGVDLDGTLAFHEKWKGPFYIGDPIPEMIQKVKNALAQGDDVRIFTARADKGVKVIGAIKKWCLKHIGQELEVTNVKDMHCHEIWDDRARQVIRNKGKFVDE